MYTHTHTHTHTHVHARTQTHRNAHSPQDAGMVDRESAQRRGEVGSCWSPDPGVMRARSAGLPAPGKGLVLVWSPSRKPTALRLALDYRIHPAHTTATKERCPDWRQAGPNGIASVIPVPRKGYAMHQALGKLCTERKDPILGLAWLMTT